MRLSEDFYAASKLNQKSLGSSRSGYLKGIMLLYQTSYPPSIAKVGDRPFIAFPKKSN